MTATIDKQRLSSSLLKKRIILMDGDLNEELYDFVRLALLHLNDESTAPITLHVHSKGGIAWSGLLLCDLISSTSAPVTAIVWSAASAAFTAVQACKKRLATKSSGMLIHCSRLKTGFELIYDENWDIRIRAAGDFLQNNEKRKMEIFHKRSGLSQQRLRSLMKAGELGTWIMAPEAKKLRLIDGIVPDNYDLFKPTSKKRK